MAEIYVSDNYLDDLFNYLKANLKKRYGSNCVLDKPRRVVEYISDEDLKLFTTRENITNLLKLDYVEGLNKEEFLRMLLLVNNNLHAVYIDCFDGIDIFTEPIPVTDHKISWKEAVEWYRIHDNTNKFRERPFIRICEKIRKNYIGNKTIRKKGQRVIKSKKEPFLLGLVLKYTLYDFCTKLNTILSEYGYELDD